MQSILRIFFIAILFTATFQLSAQQTSIQQATVQSLSPASLSEPSGFLKKFMLHDDVTTFYLMPGDEVFGKSASGAWEKQGIKMAPPRGYETVFSFMLKLDHITYGVDKEGNLWQRNGPFKEIIGRTM